MKFIDKIKSEKIASLMCISGCQTPSCFAKAYTPQFGGASFLCFVPVLLYLLLQLIANKKKKEVSFKKFFGCLLLVLPVYLLIYYGLFWVLGKDLLVDGIRSMSFFLYLSLSATFLVLLFLKTVSRNAFFLPFLLSCMLLSIAWLGPIGTIADILLLLLLFSFKKVSWAFSLIPFLMLCGVLLSSIISYC